MSERESLYADATPGPWYAVVNDLVGGWSLATVNLPMSQVDPRGPHHFVADFTNEADARLIAHLRNQASA